jgi:hypothetical protein
MSEERMGGRAARLGGKIRRPVNSQDKRPNSRIAILHCAIVRGTPVAEAERSPFK